MLDGRADELAAKVADSVRQAIAEADQRAAEIIREAEAEAAGVRQRAEAEAAKIRERAEADARGQIEAAKRALDELGGTLVAAASEAVPIAETPGAPEAPISPSAGNGGDAAERLVAMKLAVDGEDPAAIEAELIDRFGPGDRSALLSDVISRVER
jgi:hypothetical protein